MADTVVVAEGHDPVLVEFAAKSQGMVMPPLKVFDEVSLALGVKAFKSRELILGDKLDYAGIRLVEALVEAGRNGKIVKQGFYDWETRRIWSGLSELVTATPETTGLEYLQRRLMLAQAAEIGRILDEGILRNHRDGDIGAIFGLGFAPNSGGPFAWMDRQGLPELVAELREFAEEAGERYTPSATLVRMADNGERFYEEV